MDRFYARPLFIYAIGFIIPYLLTWVPFVTEVGRYYNGTHTLIISAIVSHTLGLGLGAALFRTRTRTRTRRQERLHFDVRTSGKALYLWYALAVASLLFEYQQIGGFPLFMADIELKRLQLQVNGYVHLIAISLSLVCSAMLYFSHYVARPRKRVLFIALSVLGFSLLAMTGNRSDVGIAIIVTIIAILLRDSKPIRIINVIQVAAVAVTFSAINFLRLSGPQYIEMISGQLIGSRDPIRIIFYPIYMTLTYNFTILDRIVRAGAGATSDGLYTFYAFISLLPGKQEDFGYYKNKILGINFYSELTSTYISNFYVDFGFVGALICTFILALFISYIYAKARREPRYILLYALVYTHFVIFFYVYIYVYLSAVIAIVLFWAFCRFSLSDDDGRSG